MEKSAATLEELKQDARKQLLDKHRSGELTDDELAMALERLELYGEGSE